MVIGSFEIKVSRLFNWADVTLFIHQLNNSDIISRGLITMFAIACGIAVANIYYCQPLLMLFVDTFHCTTENAGWIASVIQCAYAIGLIIFVPLGDKVSHHKLILTLVGVNIVGSIAAALSPNFTIFLMANILIGLTSVSAQIIIPAISLFTSPAQRGKVIGSVMSGLFAGVLLARTLSGFVGEYAGWRTVYVLAALLDIGLIFIVWIYLPRNVPHSNISYLSLLRSLWILFWKEPILRLACLSGFLLFAAFSVLWGSLAFLLAQPPYEFRSEMVGAFGLASVVGILLSSYIGALADKLGSKKIVMIGAVLISAAFIVISQAQFYIGALILGIVMLDLGGRASVIGNQHHIFSLAPEARSRMNTIFMSCYFVGGAAGTKLGSVAAASAGWFGVGVLGAVIAGLVILFISVKFLSNMAVKPLVN